MCLGCTSSSRPGEHRLHACTLCGQGHTQINHCTSFSQGRRQDLAKLLPRKAPCFLRAGSTAAAEMLIRTASATASTAVVHGAGEGKPCLVPAPTQTFQKPAAKKARQSRMAMPRQLRGFPSVSSTWSLPRSPLHALSPVRIGPLSYGAHCSLLRVGFQCWFHRGGLLPARRAASGVR